MPNSRGIFAVVVLSLAPFTHTLAQTTAKPSAPPAGHDFSQESAVILESKTIVKIEDDGTSIEEESVRVRIQSDAGVKSYGLFALSYESGLGSHEIAYVRVRKPDGTVIDTPNDNVQDMPSEITRQAPFYSDLREKHIAVKGLSVGDIIEYKSVQHVTKPLAPGQFWFAYTYAKDVIVLQHQLEVSVPSARAIKIKSPGRTPAITESGSYRMYSWSYTNLSHPAKDEDKEELEHVYQAARGRSRPFDIQLTSFQSWDELARWYAHLQSDRVQPTSEIVAKAGELTKGAADDDAKLHAIYDYVSLQYRYIGIAFGVGRYQPHFASEVLANQYGDCKDKHTLFAALLNAAGIKAYPVLISTERDLDPDQDLPSPIQFNHVITVVPRGNKLLYLDTTPEVAPFQYLVPTLRDKHALLVWNDKPAAWITTPADLPFPFTQDFRLIAKMDDSATLTGAAVFTNRGDMEVLLRTAFRAVPMPQWKDLVQRVSQSLGFAGEVSDVEVSSPEKTSEPLRISYNYHRKDFGDWQNHQIPTPSLLITLPVVPEEISDLTAPIWLGGPLDVIAHTELEIPSNYTLEVPDPIHERYAFAQFDATFAFKAGKLFADRRFKTLKREVPPSDLTAYRHFVKTVYADYGAFIPLTYKRDVNSPTRGLTRVVSIMGDLRDLPDSSDPESLRLEKEGADAFGTNAYPAGIADFYGSVTADPKNVRVWALLGEVLMATNKTEQGMDAFEKALTLAPKEPAIPKAYGYALLSAAKYKEALPVWQGYVKLAPEDPDGMANLGECLINLQRYNEAIQPLETLVKDDPDNVDYQLKVATAYAGVGDQEKSAAAFVKVVDLDPTPPMLHQAALHMLESSRTLPVALDVAKHAVLVAEKASLDIDIHDLRPGDESYISTIADYWTTLGRVQAKLGNNEDAEKTLLSAWKLTQSGLAAFHLCQLYDSENKTQAALEMCRFAHSRLPQESALHLRGLSDIVEQNDALLEKLNPSSSNSFDMATSEHIANMRDQKLPHVYQGQATAEYLLQVDFDPRTNAFKVTGSKFVNGSDKLKPFAGSLAKLNLSLTSPDGNPLRVLRRGTFLCGGGNYCEFLLNDANVDNHSIPIPMHVGH